MSSSVIMQVLGILISLSKVWGQLTRISTIPPNPYGGISSGYVSSQNTIYFFSGISSETSYVQGIQRLKSDKSSLIWTYISENDPSSPQPRSYYGSFIFNNNYYIYGGIGPQGTLKDLWVYDTSNDFWQQVFTKNSIPKRYGFAYTSFSYKNDFYFAVVGGRSGQVPDTLNDFYLYSLSQNSWITLSSIQVCFQGGLTGGQLQYFNGKLFLFGGTDIDGAFLTYFTGICVYEFDDVNNGEWKLVNLPGTQMVSVEGGSAVQGNFLYRFFGIMPNDSSPLDMFRIDLNNLLAGWNKLEVLGCENQSYRNSFGYSYFGSSLLINGGFRVNKPLNSLIRLDFNNLSPTVVCKVLKEDSRWPSKRNGASIHYVNAQLVLFGGQDQGTVLNDLWVFNISSAEWSQISSYGDYPPARYRHASGVQGNYMVIRGGIGSNNVILQDAFLLEVQSFSWSRITAQEGSKIPPPSYSSCLLLDFPKIYSVGGVETSHVTLSIWEYDMTTDLYTQLYENNTSFGVQGHGCFLNKEKNHVLITTVFGSTSLSDSPLNAMVFFNLSSRPLTPVLKLNRNESFLARSHFSYHMLGNYTLVLSGGERFLQEFLKDQWIIDARNFDSFRISDLPVPSYLAASSFFNNTLSIFSGFSNNGFSYLASSSEFYMNVQMINFGPRLPFVPFSCGRGMFLNNGFCSFCPPGSYNNLLNSSTCFPCPAGSRNPNSGSTSMSQCIPCPTKTYSESNSSVCLNCSDKDLCQVGSSNKTKLTGSDMKELKDFKDYKKQPKMLEPKNIQGVKMILWLTALGLIVVFTVVFCLDYRVRILLSFYDIFRNMHFEVHSTQTGTLIEREPGLSPSKLGGFLTVVTLVLLFSLAINSLVTFFMTNEEEQVIFVPIDSLIDDKDYDSERLDVTLMFSSYRGRCSLEYLNVTTSSHIHLKSREFEEKTPFCYFYLKLKISKMIESGDFIFVSLTDQEAYSSDINIRLKTSSSVPDKDSSVTQSLALSPDQILRGEKASVFTFSLLPAYYSEEGIFHDETHKGYMLSSSLSPEAGSIITPEEIGLVFGLNIQINLLRVELGYTTYKYPKVDFFDFIFKFMNDFPGTIVLVGFFMWFIELFVSYCSGVRSGRMRLAKKHILIERNKRNSADLLETDRDSHQGIN